jgi:hypoxanthine phosphoribosyltransferase
MKCKIVTFAEIHDMVKSVAEQVKRSSFEPTTIVGLARGGTIPARLMCDFLGITDLISLKVEHWIETGKTKDEATIKYPLKADLSEKVILVLDDITDTGKSLVVSTDYLAKMKPLAMKVATLQYMPESTFKPDYFAEEVKVWTWFIYPWNWIEDTSTLIIRLMSTAKDRTWKQSEVNKDLLDNFEIEWDSKMLEYILHVMDERGQVDVIGDPSGITYKIKEEKVIKL